MPGEPDLHGDAQIAELARALCQRVHTVVLAAAYAAAELLPLIQHQHYLQHVMLHRGSPHRTASNNSPADAQTHTAMKLALLCGRPDTRTGLRIISGLRLGKC